MKLRASLLAVVVLAGTALCGRLGLWQLSRWQEKRGLNAEMRAAEHAPTVEMGGGALPFERVRGRYAAIAGRYDESRQVLIGGGLRDEVPGAELITPLVLEDGSAILVNRGWIPAQEPQSVRLGEYAEPGPRRVIGYPEPIGTGGRTPAMATRSSDDRTAFWGRALDRDTLSARIPYRLASYALREAPGPGVPPRPARSRPQPLDEGMHLGYAVQWFVFGLILLGGSSWLAWQRRKPRARAASFSEPSRSP